MTISKTAQFMAGFRALESARLDDGLFDDPWAERFLSLPMRVAAKFARLRPVGRLLERWIDAKWPGAWSSAVARTCLIDEWIRDAMALGIVQVVILGAGFDTRPWRLSSLNGVTIFQIDRPGMLEYKRMQLRKSAPAGNCGVRDIPIDFEKDNLEAGLRQAGFQDGQKTLFIWEGVTNYLDDKAVAAVFDLVAMIAAVGSRIIFTYVHADIITGKFDTVGTRKLAALLAASGENWTFGLYPEQASDYLRAHSLSLLRDLGAGEYRPLVMGTRADGLKGYEFYRLAMAETVPREREPVA